MAQHTIQIPITADTYVNMNSPTTNYGASLELHVGGGKRTEGEYYRNYKIELLLKWNNTSSIPSRKQIISKYLCMYALTTWGANCRLYAASPKDFDEMTATWNNWRGTSTHVSTDTIDAHEDGINKYLKFNILNKDTFNGLCEVGAEDSASPSSILKFSSRESDNPPYIEVTYEDVPPSAPTPTEPIGQYKDSKSITRFGWTYNSDVGGVQKAFDLQWSTDQSTWTTVSETTANNYCDMPADTLPAGNIYWRVRCYNEYDEVGAYCDIQSFYAIGAPEAPVLNAIPANSARPVVSWSAFSQQVYQLQVLSGDSVVYDSGTVPGINIRSHKVTAWLADGSYTVQLRIKNEYDMWSSWGSAAVTIATVKPAKPTLVAEKTTTGIKLTLPIGRMLIYRDGVCIGETSTGEYIDNAVANGREYSYTARVVECYPEQQITNLLGSDGDCEDTSKLATVNASLSLDTNNRVSGANGIKISADASGQVIAYMLPSLDAEKHYFFSAYVKSGGQVIGIGASTYYGAYSSDTTKFVRVGVVVAGSFIPWLGFSATAAEQVGYIDGIMINEITVDEYNNLTIDQLMQKYPFGNNTFTAPASEVFTDSDLIKATAEFKNALIAPVSDLSSVFTFSRSLNAPPKRVFDRALGGAMVQYAGRKHPVWEPTEHISAGLSLSFFLRTWAEVETFTAIYDLNGTVLYRDAKGRKAYGVLGNLSVNDEWSGYTVSFTLTEVDYAEEVEA